MPAVLSSRDGNPLSRIALPSPVIRQYSHLSHCPAQKVCSKSTFQINFNNKEEEVCQKLVRSSVIAAEPLAAKN